MNLVSFIKELTSEERAALTALVERDVRQRDQKWTPEQGQQAEGYCTKADHLFYGGAAGGGKTDLGLGLALNEHKKSLILRRINKDAMQLVPRLEEILGHRDGFNGQQQRWRLPNGRTIDIAGCEMEVDKQRFKGTPHDLIVFDEASDFLESQFRFIIGWNRTTEDGQRCRVVCTSNPPTTPEGLWVVKYWAPWLDPNHPNPARPGELRWFTVIGGVDTEVDGPGPHKVEGETEPIYAKSRTFIPAKLSDNRHLTKNNDYAATLASLPEELQRAYRKGDFTVGLSDDAYQVIPTAWIDAAQQRWTPAQPDGLAMTAMAVDIAQGGSDKTVLAYRFGGWFGPLDALPGSETRDGNNVSAMVVRRRRDRCPVIVDVGGGWGGDAVIRMKDNGIAVVPFHGVTVVSSHTRDGKIKFRNKRAEAWWRMREALDPEQEGGSAVALPPDSELKADLASCRWKNTVGGILIEDKTEVRKRIGRSPDRGDAVVMCLSEGQNAQRRELMRSGGNMPKVNLGYAKLKRHMGR